MYVYWEVSSSARSDCDIHCLSWIGAIPDYVSNYNGMYNKPYKLSRLSYYKEGWLATGNANNIVGVTYTGCHTQGEDYSIPTRTNFNLRGHRNEVGTRVSQICNFAYPGEKTTFIPGCFVMFVFYINNAM